MAQMQMYTGLPQGAVQLLFVGFVLHGLAGALLPNSPTYSDKNLQVGQVEQQWGAYCWPAGLLL
jgi:hypothetical protein